MNNLWTNADRRVQEMVPSDHTIAFCATSNPSTGIARFCCGKGCIVSRRWWGWRWRWGSRWRRSCISPACIVDCRRIKQNALRTSPSILHLLHDDLKDKLELSEFHHGWVVMLVPFHHLVHQVFFARERKFNLLPGNNCTFILVRLIRVKDKLSHELHLFVWLPSIRAGAFIRSVR